MQLVVGFSGERFIVALENLVIVRRRRRRGTQCSVVLPSRKLFRKERRAVVP